MAEENYRKTIKITIEHYGVDHFELAITYLNLGNVFSDQGKLELAEENYRKALKLQIGHYGEDHFQLATTYMNLGAVFWK